MFYFFFLFLFYSYFIFFLKMNRELNMEFEDKYVKTVLTFCIMGLESELRHASFHINIKLGEINQCFLNE